MRPLAGLCEKRPLGVFRMVLVNILHHGARVNHLCDAGPQPRIREHGCVNATLLVCIPMGIISTLLFGTTTGLPVLDVLDKFVNTYGIVAAGFVYVLAIIALRKLPELRNHLNALSSVHVGAIWTACVIFTVTVQLAAEVNWLADHVRWDVEEDLARLQIGRAHV